MAAPSFAGIPLELREQIYHQLLTFQSEPTAQASASVSPICKLLTLSRQIHDEILQFLQSQLLIILKTNDPEFVAKIVKEEWAHRRLALLSQLRSLDGSVTKNASTAPIAMEVDFYMFHNDLPAESYPAFLIPAASLADMMGILWSPSFYIWIMQASLRFNMLNNFSMSKEGAQKQLLRPWLDAFLKPTFVGIFTDSTIDIDLTGELKAALTGEYDAMGHLRKLQSLQQRAIEHGGAEDWDAATARFQMAMRYTRVIWNCHLDCMRAPETLDCICHLWLITNSMGASQVQILLNSATGDPSLDIPTGNPAACNDIFRRARQVAEETISFLRSHPEWGHPATANNSQTMKALRKSKALMSFRAHKACKGMGDINAAVGYLNEARKYEPETSAKLDERIDALIGEGAREEGIMESIVTWEE